MSAINKFRQKFVPKTKITKWFPGHMVKGLRDMQSLLKRVDCVIEVHDARIPFTGRNSNFHSLLAAKPHLLILNKMDLTDPESMYDVQDVLMRQSSSQVLYTNCGKGTNCTKILPTVLKMVRESERYNRADNSDISLMVVGIPNVGKSSTINKLRKLYGNFKNPTPAQVGALPGVTKAVMEKVKICENPPVYLYDTPGVLHPRDNSVEAILRMTLCSTLSDPVVGVEVIADYLLFWLNKRKQFSYVDAYGLDGPIDDIGELLVNVAIKCNFVNKITQAKGEQKTVFNMDAAAADFLKRFRDGKLGLFLLDDSHLRKHLKEPNRMYLNPNV